MTEIITEHILVFKTNIQTQQQIKTLGVIFNHYSQIIEWSVDTEDVDNVLRIVPLGKLKENEIIRLIRSIGFDCEALPD